MPMAAEKPPLLLAGFPRAVTFLPALDQLGLLQVLLLCTEVGVSHPFPQEELTWLLDFEKVHISHFGEDETSEGVLQQSRDWPQYSASFPATNFPIAPRHLPEIRDLPCSSFVVWFPLQEAP